MKKFKGLKWRVFFVLLLAVPAASFAYDTSPHFSKLIPEAIWAAATGGGTWTTEVQIYARDGTSPVNIEVWFFYGGGLYRGPFTLTGLAVQNMTRYTNILETIDALDTGAFTYYGRVGTVWFQTDYPTSRIQVQARTVHSGGYGKTMNALSSWNEGDSAAFSPTWRGMMIQGITQSSTYRSTIGLLNCSTIHSITVRVALISYDDAWLGSEDITLLPLDFFAFNPFIRFGVTGTYPNCRIWINPIAGDGRCMAFGATVNNTTNDPAAHIAVQYD